MMDGKRMVAKRALAFAIAGLALTGKAPLAQTAEAPAYDVVSIKPDKTTGCCSVRVSTTSDRFVGTNVSVKVLIQSAYDLKTPEQISGLTGWANSANFDIEAKMDAETAATLKGLSQSDRQQKQRLMMQALLADRFQLKVHSETRELPLYELETAKNGSKLNASDATSEHPNGIAWADGASYPGRISMTDNKMMSQAISMSDLAANLSMRVHRQVVDKTGLTGKYDFALEWAGDDASPEVASRLPSLVTALEEQLGLKLEGKKGRVETIVVDHVAMPSEN